jgi:putative endonuclease
MGEVDIICEHPDRTTIVFVEVKTRRDDHISPAYAVNAAKRRKLRDLSLALARRNGWEQRPLRIDVVTVVWPSAGRPDIAHLENVIGHDGR